MNFAYELVRLWERPADAFLKGGLGTLPFAVLGALPADVPTEDALAGVARQVIGRLEQEAAPEQSRKLLTMAFVLIGLRVNRNVALEVFRGVRQMKDSDTYMAILEEGLEKGLERGREEGFEKGREEGREEELRQLILMLAEEYFGPVEESVLARINAMSDLNLLRRIVRRIPKEPSLEALLETS
jgi:predicted transposase YdaD